MFKRMVGELAKRPVLVPLATTVAEAAAVMAEHGVHFLAVLSGRRVVGFVAERALCRHLDVDLEPGSPIGDLLDRAVPSVTRTTLVEDAVKSMLEHHVRHLLVLEAAGGNLAGLVTDKELVDALAVDFMVANVICRDLLRPDTVVAAPQEPVRDALARLRERDVSCVLVVEGGKPAGIFSERDAVTKILGHPERLSEPLSRHMSAPVVCVPDTAMVYKVILFMRQKGVRRLAVVDDDGRLAGILSQRHILAYARRLG
jgi:CBS domain-containing protein